MGTKGSFPRTNRQRRSADYSYHPYVVPKLGMSGAIPLFFLHAFVVYTGTTVLLKENVSLFRCSHYIRTVPRTPEGNQHKRNTSETFHSQEDRWHEEKRKVRSLWEQRVREEVWLQETGWGRWREEMSLSNIQYSASLGFKSLCEWSLPLCFSWFNSGLPSICWESILHQVKKQPLPFRSFPMPD